MIVNQKINTKRRRLYNYLLPINNGGGEEKKEDANIVTVANLIDAFVGLYEDCECMVSNLPPSSPIATFIKKNKSKINCLKSMTANAADFECVKLLGKGAFGEVMLVKCSNNDEDSIGSPSSSAYSYYAMKKLKKSEMLKASDTSFFMEERDVMILSRECNWLNSIHTAFQDSDNLYLIMDFFPGGDLMTLLCKQDYGVFSEATAKFYIAELVLAVKELHSLGYVHRDIKPDNLLISQSGHIKLTDFGSCAKLSKDGSQIVLSNSSNGSSKSSAAAAGAAVGTPDYISPEVLKAQSGKCNYGAEADWWSVGIVLYEMLVGDPPFYADSLAETYGKIMNFQSLEFPSQKDNPTEEDEEELAVQHLSETVKDLLKKLICPRETRLGRNGNVQEIMSHPFFEGIQWDIMKDQVPPFVPELDSMEDTRNFDDLPSDFHNNSLGDDSRQQLPAVVSTSRVFAGLQLPFIGYSFCDDSEFINTLQFVHQPVERNGSSQIDENTILELTKEIEALKIENESQIKKYNCQLQEFKAKAQRDKEEAVQAIEQSSTIQINELKNQQSRLNTLLMTSQEDLEKKKALIEEIKQKTTKYISETKKKEAHLKADYQAKIEKIIKEWTAADTVLESMKNEYEKLSIAFGAETKAKVLCGGAVEESKEAQIHLKQSLQNLKFNYENEIKSLKSLNLQLESDYESALKEHVENDVLHKTLLRDEEMKFKLKMEEYEKLIHDLKAENAAALVEKQNEMKRFHAQMETITKERDCLRDKSNLDNIKISELVRKMELSMSAASQQTTGKPLGGIFSSVLPGKKQRNESAVAASTKKNPTTITQSVSMGSGTAGLMDRDDDKKLLKLTRQDLKATEQRLNSEIAQRVNVEHELAEMKVTKSTLESEVEDLRKRNKQLINSLEKAEVLSLKNSISVNNSNSYNELSHQNSVKSASSIFSALKKGSLEVVFGDYNSSAGVKNNIFIEGGLKIPSIKGVRYGWKKTWAIVAKDLHLYLCEKDREITSMTKIILDLRAKFVRIESVNQNELIHVSPKEVLCIFKIQSTNSSIAHSHNSIAVDTNASLSLENIVQDYYLREEHDKDAVNVKIEKLKKEISTEEKIKRGTQTLLWASKGSSKKEIQKNIDECNRRLENLNRELEKLTRLADSLQDGSKSTMNLDQVSSCSASSCSLYEINGHRFSVVTSRKEEQPESEFATPSFCQVCQSQLISKTTKPLGISHNSLSKKKSGSNMNISGAALNHISLECEKCKINVHKSCYALMTESCEEVVALNAVKPIYLMAANESDCKRWIDGLKKLREVALNSVGGGGGGCT